MQSLFSKDTNPDDCFETAPEFVDEDNRQFRTHNPVSKEQMRNKHEVLFPEYLIKGKTILDLGSCLGATGHWCLSHGAAHYTGVEVQKEYTSLAAKLLEKYHPGKSETLCMSLEQFFETNTKQYDVVALLGVLYVFVDYYSILKKLTDIAKEQLIFENLSHPSIAWDPDFAV
jgi:cyclopropane fatty-acyl-phospholipid synthase-like methyltransferase